MNEELTNIMSYQTALARAVGKYEGLTKFLIESPDNTMTKEDVAGRMQEILQEFKAATTRPSREREIEREEFYSHLGRV